MRPVELRSPQTCKYRRLEKKEGIPEKWYCGFISGITGAGDSSFAAVRPDECALCCSISPPVPERPNYLTASLLLTDLGKIIAQGGVPGCTVGRAKELLPLAEDNLYVWKPADFEKEATVPRRGLCRHLGAQSGERLCQDCTGRVRVKVFECEHPGHLETTIRGCDQCEDYDPELMPGGGVTKWAIGITTSPRRQGTLRRTLRSFRDAGWKRETVHIFAEKGSAHIWDTLGLGPFRVVRRAAPRSGAWPSFLLGLAELFLRDPKAEAYLMIQDDVDLVGGLKEYLSEILWPAKECGCVSLHTPSHLAAKSGAGFFKAELWGRTWGAQGFIFPNESVRALLSDRIVIEHRLRGIGDGMQNVDSVVGEWCWRNDRPFWLHAPSLVEHTGLHSTLWERQSLEGRRSSKDFPGCKTDIRTHMASLPEETRGTSPDPVMMLSDGVVVPATDDPAPAVPAQGKPGSMPDTVPITLAESLAAVYVLNLSRRSDRFAEFQAKARDAGLTGHLSPVRIDAVDGREFPKLHASAVPAESATTMGHRYIWGLALAKQAPVLILEDDAFFCRRFASHLREPISLPNDADALELGMSWLQLHSGEGPVRRVKFGWGTFAYVLFPQGAAKLLQLEAKGPLAQADLYTRPSEDFNVYITYPTWVTVRNEDSDIRPRPALQKRMGLHFEDDRPSESPEGRAP